MREQLNTGNMRQERDIMEKKRCGGKKDGEKMKKENY